MAIFAFQIAMRMTAGEGRRMQFLSHGTQQRYEGIFQHGIRDAEIAHGDPRFRQRRFHRRAARRGILHNHVQPVAKPLDISDHAVFGFRQPVLGLRQIVGVDLQPPHAQAVAQFNRRAGLVDPAEMHQRDLVAALGFIQIRRGHHNGQAVRGQVRQGVPEFAAGDRVDARSGFIQQQHARLRHQRADQRQLLLHAAAQLSRQPVRETVHVEHLQIALAPRRSP
jgi:hypothetical protein